MIQRRAPLKRSSKPLRRTRRPAAVRRIGPKRALKNAHDALALLIKDRDGQRCVIDLERWRPGKEHTYWLPLQAMHGIRREYRGTTLDSRNLFTGCAGCHKYFTEHSEEWTEWLRERMGADALEALRRVALARPKLDPLEALAAIRAGGDWRAELLPGQTWRWFTTPVTSDPACASRSDASTT